MSPTGSSLAGAASVGGGTDAAHALIAARARRHPSAVALTFGQTRVSYGELNSSADRLASVLRAAGTGRGTLIGVLAENCPEIVVAVLAILKTGAGFVPLEPTYPDHRLAFMCDDAGLQMVLAQEKLADRVPAGRSVVHIDDTLRGSEVAAEAEAHIPVSDEDVSCVLYTSGSTGRPKGVVRLHRAITHRLSWMTFDSDDVCCHNMPLSFGFSQERLLVPLSRGLRLAIIPAVVSRDPRALVEAIADAAVTQITMPPAVLRQIVELGPTYVRPLLRRVRKLAVGGAVLERGLADAFRQLLPGTLLENAYGSTETGSAIRGPVGDDGPITIGCPLPNVAVLLLDEHQRHVPDGEPGEMYVGGPSIAREYLRDAETTRQRFVPNSLPASSSPVLYRTGDIARRVRGGALEYLGRADRQVKIRGHRVELAEVEAALGLNESVQEAVATVRGGERDRKLCAYVVLRQHAELTPPSLRDFLSERLPAHMVPSALVFINQIPRTAVGKIDVDLLPAPGRMRPELATDFVGARSDREREATRIWEELLGFGGIGVHDNFFELGGDSLLAVNAVVALAGVWNVEIPSERLFAHPTIADLCRAIETAALRQAPLPTAGSQKPLSLSLEANLAGDLNLRRFGRRPASNIGFAFSLDGTLDLRALQVALNEIVSRHEILRTAFVPRLSVTESLKQSIADRHVRLVVQLTSTLRTHAVVKVETCDISAVPSPERLTALEPLCASVLDTPYEYERPPFVRVGIARVSPTKHWLVLGVSHLVFDGWSRTLFLKELAAAYQGAVEGSAALPRLQMQFADCALRQRTRMADGRLARIADFWLDRYRAYPPIKIGELQLTLRRPSSAVYHTQFESIDLDDDVTTRLRQIAARNRVSLFTVWFALVSIVLHARVQHRRFSVGTFFANRIDPGSESLIGDFATYHAVPCDFAGNPSTAALLRSLHQAVASTLEYQEVPVTTINAVLAAKRATGGAQPVLAAPEVSFALLPEPRPESAAGLLIQRMPVPRATPQDHPGPLMLRCVESRRGWQLQAGYRSDRLEVADVQQFLRAIHSLAVSVQIDPAETVAECVARLETVGRSVSAVL